MRNSVTLLLVVQSLLNPTLTMAFYSMPSRTRPKTSSRPPALQNWAYHRKIQHRIYRNTRSVTFKATATTLSSWFSPLNLSSNLACPLFLTRMIFLRAMAFVYAIAFLIAFRQNKALIGDHGITPARNILNQAQMIGKQRREQRLQWRQQLGDVRPPVPLNKDLPQNSVRAIPLLNLPYIGWKQLMKYFFYVRRFIGRTFDRIPALTNLREIWWDRADRQGRPITTLLWWASNRHNLNPWLDGMAMGGIIISMFILLTGVANVPLVFSLWILHRSIMNVGGPWYGFGWEPQLGEVGFHAMFMVPLLSLWNVMNTPVHPAVAWCIRWHLFRVRPTDTMNCLLWNISFNLSLCSLEPIER